MCLLIVKPKGPVLERDWLMHGSKSNPHGSGAVWTSRKGMFHSKGLYNDDKFADFTLKNVGSRAAMVHFRFSTHGTVSKENCHPFPLINGWFMAHNGIISGLDHPTKSDSALYAEIIIARLTLDPHYFDREESEYQMATEIGGSKLGFLHESGRHIIINEHLGEWEKGVWFSNSGHKPYTSCYFGQYSIGGWAEWDGWAEEKPDLRFPRQGEECTECYAPLHYEAVLGEKGPICRDCAEWQKLTM